MAQHDDQGDQVERHLQEWKRVLDDYQTRIVAWKGKTDVLDPEAKVHALERIRRVEERVQSLKDRIAAAEAQHLREQTRRAEALDEFKAGASDAWESLKTGIEQAWTEVKSTLRESSSNRK